MTFAEAILEVAGDEPIEAIVIINRDAPPDATTSWEDALPKLMGMNGLDRFPTLYAWTKTLVIFSCGDDYADWFDCAPRNPSEYKGTTR